MQKNKWEASCNREGAQKVTCDASAGKQKRLAALAKKRQIKRNRISEIHIDKRRYEWYNIK